MRRIIMLSILLAIALIGVPSCAQGVSQQEYDRVNSELQVAQDQLASLEGKLAETESKLAQSAELNKQYYAVQNELETLQADYEALSAEYDELSQRPDPAQGELEAMQAEYENLSAEYDELNKQFEELSEQYDLIIEGKTQINAEDVEQALFDLINQERENNGLDELEQGENLYKWAMTNSRTMATNKREEYSDYGSWQAAYWTAGHSTAERTADATLAVWKNRQEYEKFFLNVGARYFAVAVYQSGEVFYITYLADYFN